MNALHLTPRMEELGGTGGCDLKEVVSPKGAVTIYQQTPTEKSETSTVLVLLTINAAGDSALSIEIFKGVRVTDQIRKSAPPSINVNIPPLKLIRKVRKRASGAKKISPCHWRCYFKRHLYSSNPRKESGRKFCHLA